MGYYPFLLLFCGFWGMGGAFISLFISKWMAKTMMKVKIIDPRTSNSHLRDLVDMVHDMAKKAKLPKMPEVGVYEANEVNAFATGPSKSNSLVAVSSGLLNRMNREEIKGVLGHEVAHIANGDMVTMTLIQGVVNAFVMFFARIVANIIGSQVDEKIRWVVQFGLIIVLQIVFSILGAIVVNFFSRFREFRADYGGAKYAGKEAMISALKALQNTTQLLDTNERSKAFASLKISGKRGTLAALLSTHPELDVRIRRLERTPLS